MTPAEAATILRQFNEWRRGDEDIPQFDPREIGEAIDAAVEMIERLEAAEKERDALRNEIAFVKEVEFPRKAQAVADAWEGKCKRLEVERAALRAKIEAMEKQEPVAWLHESRRDSDVVTSAVKHVWGKAAVGSMAAYSIPLYLAPGAKGEEK